VSSTQARPLVIALERLLRQDSDPAQVAAAFVAVWRSVDAALGPMLGPQGVAAMHRRSLAQASRAHPWLPLPAVVDADPDLPSLQASLAAQPVAETFAAASAFLQAFHDLLASLVGPSLTGRLLGAVLDPPASGPLAQDLPE